MSSSNSLRIALASLVGLTLLCVAGCKPPPKPTNASVGLVVTSIDNPYFVEMIDGAKDAAAKSPPIQLNVQAPERGAIDPERQQQIVESLIARKSAALLIVPADSTQIVSSIASANKAGIPVIVLDNDVDHATAAKAGVQIAAFIGSDNVAGGQLAGDYVFKHLGDAGGDVAILEGVAGVQAAVDRKAGFMKAVSLHTSIHVVASQAADWDREKGYNVTRAILVGHPSLKAIFGANDEMALGAAKALKEGGRSDILLIGFDATPDGRKAVSEGSMSATVAQQPSEVGRLGVEYAKRLLNGDKLPARTPVPLRVIERHV